MRHSRAERGSDEQPNEGLAHAGRAGHPCLHRRSGCLLGFLEPDGQPRQHGHRRQRETRRQRRRAPPSTRSPRRNRATAKPSCIKVTYTGTLDANVRIYTPSTIGELGPNVNLKVEAGTQATPIVPELHQLHPGRGRRPVRRHPGRLRQPKQQPTPTGSSTTPAGRDQMGDQRRGRLPGDGDALGQRPRLGAGQNDRDPHHPLGGPEPVGRRRWRASRQEPATGRAPGPLPDDRPPARARRRLGGPGGRRCWRWRSPLPLAFGARPHTVLTGSMEPAISPGDVVINERIAPPAARVGDVVTFRDPEDQSRLSPTGCVSIRRAGSHLWFVTQGDANNTTERWRIAADGELGRVAYTVPWVGHVAVFTRTPLGLALLLIVPLLLLGLDELVRIWRPPAREGRAVERPRSRGGGARRGRDLGPGAGGGAGGLRRLRLAAPRAAATRSKPRQTSGRRR